MEEIGIGPAYHKKKVIKSPIFTMKLERGGLGSRREARREDKKGGDMVADAATEPGGRGGKGPE